LGEIRLGEMGLGEMGLGEMGQNRRYLHCTVHHLVSLPVSTPLRL